MILSRVPITLEIVQVLLRISSCALPSQTSVPCESPEIWSRSENCLGWDSISIPRTKFVPISGSASVPVLHSISCSVTPSASGDVNRLITAGSLIGISFTLIPVISSKYLYMVGTSCPSSSSFRMVSCREWKSKCVVVISELGSSAGRCTAVKS